MSKYTVAQVGCGNRGKVHIDGWLAKADRFELVALCEVDEAKMRQAVEERGIAPALYSDAERMLAETKPEVFCFVTQPDVRLSMVALAVAHGVRGIALEKPMATSLKEAWAMTRLCRQHGIKAVVSHQQKYLTSLQKVKELVDAGEIGDPLRVDATCQGWLSQLGTHFVDYILWANGGHRAKWVVGHVHGKELLADSHPSPNYCMGHVEFENGVRSFFEFGRLSDSHMPREKFWLDNRLAIYGTHGYAWGDTDGRWEAFTRSSNGEVLGEVGEGWGVQERTRLQPPYLRDLADWLDDDQKLHPCNLELAYHGYEILTGMCLSALDCVRVDLPLDPESCGDVFERMRCELRECPERVA